MNEDSTAPTPDTPPLGVNPGYATFQLAKALTTGTQHADAATRERANDKAARWIQVINGLLDGSITAGSRTPLAGVPGWATPEVVTGGFATGALLAAGPLRSHEHAQLAGLGWTGQDTDARLLLNGHCLTDTGLAQLQDMLRHSRYEVNVPEEGALLVAAWLVQHGHVNEARALVDALSPYFATLRFYPVPSDRPHHAGTHVFVQPAGAVASTFQNVRPNPRIQAQKEAIEIWGPLYDQMVGILLETVAGPLPCAERDSAGKVLVHGAWPCSRYPDGWAVRARALLAQYDRQRALHQRCGKPERSKDSFAQVRHYLQRCAVEPDALTGRDVGRIRLLLGRYVAKRGAPDTARCQAVRAQQKRQTEGPAFDLLAQVLVPRLQQYPKDEGLDDLGEVTQPVTAAEAAQWHIPAAMPIPACLQRKLRRCQSGTVDALVGNGLITSGETLARVLPQVTSGLRAAGIADPSLRQIYASIYRAFRQRRSLLLLNLQKQVQIEELPWVACIDRFRSADLPGRELARQALEEITLVAIRAFPQAILPNKLLQELRALAKTAEIDLPLTEELAADIFMGAFSPKFVVAARQAASLLDGTLYAMYYGIDCHVMAQLPVDTPAGSLALLRLCEDRAGVSFGAYDTATNGMLIEQQQILTTQNLAVLLAGLKLNDAPPEEWNTLAQRCFKWICQRLQVKVTHRHAQLIQIKNAAYAWRQMVFFLALLPRGQAQVFVAWAQTHLDGQPRAFCVRFQPALQGLAQAARGIAIDSPDDSPNADTGSGPKAHRFLGWCKGQHWLLAGIEPPRQARA